MLTVTDNYGLTSAAAIESVIVGERHPEEEASRQQAEQEVVNKQAEAAAKTRREEEAPKIQVLGIQEASPDAAVASLPLRASASGAVTVKISCPAGDRRCVGTVTLRTLKAVVASLDASKTKPAVLKLGAAAFTLAGGKVVTVVLHLSDKARALLERLHTLRVRVTIVAYDPVGASNTGQTITTLLAPRRTHGGH
jgi:hypothetical protein